jgi:hypothetical protein
MNMQIWSNNRLDSLQLIDMELGPWENYKLAKTVYTICNTWPRNAIQIESAELRAAEVWNWSDMQTRSTL